jgi:hypothetical protein
MVAVGVVVGMGVGVMYSILVGIAVVHTYTPQLARIQLDLY